MYTSNTLVHPDHDRVFLRGKLDLFVDRAAFFCRGVRSSFFDQRIILSSVFLRHIDHAAITTLRVQEWVDPVVGIMEVFQPTTNVDRELLSAAAVEQHRPGHTNHGDGEVLVDRLDASLEDLGSQTAGVVTRVVGHLQIEAGFPDIIFIFTSGDTVVIDVSQLEFLFALGEVEGIQRGFAFAVAHHASDDRTLSLDAFTVKSVGNHSVKVEAVVEGFADMQILEEVSGDTGAVQGATTSEGVSTFNVDVPVELSGGHCKLRQANPGLDITTSAVVFTGAVCLADNAIAFFNLRAVLRGYVDVVSIAGFKHSLAGAPFIHTLDQYVRDAGNTAGTTFPDGIAILAPVVLIGNQEDLFTGGPVIQLVGAGTIGLVEENGVFGSRVMVIYPGITGAIPTAIFDHPFLIQGSAQEGVDHHGQEPGSGGSQVVGDRAGFIVSDDSGLHLFTGGNQLVLGQIGEFFAAVANGQVFDRVQAEEGFQGHPVRAVDTVLQQGTMN